ncbi:hypothetical protein [Azotobacter armeniacus]
MTTYTGHRIEDHEDFILEQLLPLIVDYAGASDTPTEVVLIIHHEHYLWIGS